MIPKNNNKIVIVLCGHGSRNPNYKKHLIIFKKGIKKKINNFHFFHCFIEINKPSIEECLKKLANSYEKILFLPLLIFDGDHLENDIKKLIKELNYSLKKKIILIKKITLNEDIQEIYSKSLKKYLKKNSYNFLITSCSPSKKIKVLDELKEYTKDIAKINRFDRSDFFQVGQEDIIFKKIKKTSSDKPLNIILHPIFLFKGFLYEKVCENFKKKFKNVKILKPIASQKELTLIIRNKLLHTLNFVD